MKYRAKRGGRWDCTQSDGFLLAEALVSMAISAFLLVALISLTQMMVRIDKRTVVIARQVEVASRTIDALGRDIRQGGRARWAGKGSAFVFAGTSRQIQLEIQNSSTENLELVILTAIDGLPNRVLRSSTDIPAYAKSIIDIAPRTEPIEIYSGRLMVRFAYFTPIGADIETLTDEWSNPLVMPSAIRVSFADSNTGAIVSSVRIPFMIDAETGCASPRRGVCSYLETGEADALDELDLPPESVDASDPLGWMSYAR